ncbi:hypothetical protein VTN00DRAFT_1342 [Thermoascus crustaceus]|uniref:uncharacterized protein n=1 Tax=Thermoascus crustaceus TaxID=5088 RepID=UPI0037432D0B
MRLTSTLASAATGTFPWLSSLKSAQLESIAQATGIQLSGPKAVLVRRLQRELQQYEYPPQSGTRQEEDDGSKAAQGMQDTKGEKERKELSILSIDMGIQNLAFAHLLVRAGRRSNDRQLDSGPVPTLNAWHRLAVSAFPNSVESLSSTELTPSSSIFATTLAASQQKKSSKSKSKPKVKDEKTIDDQNEGKEDPEEALFIQESNNTTFSPALYASHAYTLITSLITTYNPTHILIERQRFRSGGGAVVQEWTLRVGVFEGMLYAVLHTLARERARQGQDGRVPQIVVQSIEPQRVARYWMKMMPEVVSESLKKTQKSAKNKKEKKKNRLNSTETKKAKIDVVGNWLSASKKEAAAAAANEESSSKAVKVDIGSDAAMREVVNAYLRKWEGKSNKNKTKDKKKNSSTESEEATAVDIGKVDDLADCLLQGVTWLDWQVMRGKIAREGLDAVLQLQAVDDER